MKTKKYFIALLLLITVYYLDLPAQSDRWVLAANGRNDLAWIDTKTLLSNKDLTSFTLWVKWTCVSDCISNGKKIDYSMERVNINCISRTWNQLEFVEYYPDGSYHIYTYTNPVEAIIPDSMAENILDFLLLKYR